jgi:hypothetical protein
MSSRSSAAAALVALAASATVGVPAAAGSAGHVYVETNATAAEGGNAIVVYNRQGDGRLAPGVTVPTGGNGSAVSPPLGFPLTDSQGAVSLTPNGRLLFAVNTGSNSVSSFRVHGDRLKLVDQQPTNGRFPVSVDAARGIVYVANVDPNGDNTGGGESPSLMGYRYDRKGMMRPIGDGPVGLPPESLPGAVALNHKATKLAVTLRDTPAIGWFRVIRKGARRGRLTHRTSIPSQAPSPFGLALTRHDRAVVADFGDPARGIGGSVSSYDLSYFPGDPVNSLANGQQASCWVTLAGNEKLAFITSAISGSVTEVAVARNGHLTPLAANTRTVTGFALDNAVSRDSRYLYVLASDPPGFGPDTTDHLEGFLVGAGGRLTPLPPIPGSLPPNTSGMAAT